MKTVLAVSLLFLAILTPSLAFIDGANVTSCYNQTVEGPHTSGNANMSQECVLPCSYRLNILGRVDGNGLNTSDVDLVNNMFSFRPGETFRFRLTHVLNGYLGFLIQGRGNGSDPDPDEFDETSYIYGEWNEGEYHRRLFCLSNIDDEDIPGDYLPNSVTQVSSLTLRDQHTDNGANVVTLEWTAPLSRSEVPPDGTITFWYTIVQQLQAHFLPVKGPVGMVIEEPTTPPPTTPPDTTGTTPDSSTASETQSPETTTPDSSTASETQSTGTTTEISNETGPGLGLIIGVGVGGGLAAVLIIVVVLLLVCICVCCCCKGRTEKQQGSKRSRVSMLWMSNPTSEAGESHVEVKQQ